MSNFDLRKQTKGLFYFSAILKLCAIPLNFLLANTLSLVFSAATHGNIRMVVKQSIWTFAIALTLLAVQIGGEILFQERKEKATNRCKLCFLYLVLSNPLHRLWGADHGKLQENLNDDIDTAISLYITYWPAILSGILTTVFYISYLFLLSLPLALTLLAISLFQLIPPVIVKKYMQINYDNCRDIESKITDQVVEAVEGFETIKLYGLKDWWRHRMEALHKQYIIIGNKSEATATAQISMGKLLDYLLKYGTCAVLGVFVLLNICTIDIAFLGIALSRNLYEAVKGFCLAIPNISVAQTAVSRLANWEVKQKYHVNYIENANIVINKMSYRYDKQIVFRNASVQFNENRTYLIQGANGVGKSTILRLVTGLLLPDDGEVLVGNSTPESFSDDMYPFDVLLIPQDDPEFDITACELFDMFSKCDINEIKHIASEFCIEPIRMDSCAIRELSGGERKKIYLAIAFALKPKILILDEPTNSLDNNARNVLNQLISKRSGTTLIVSHNLQCRRVADEIIKIEKRGFRYAAN